MKKFISKTSLFILLPILIWSLIEGLMPITTFTHRTYDGIFFNSFIPSNLSMYPNINSQKKAVGDLCFNTDNQIFRNEIWRTDKFGFRNNEFIKKADVLLLGDSFFLGTGLTQEDLLSNVLFNKLKGKFSVYNMSPTTISEFDKYLRLKKINKPKILVFSQVERNLPVDLIILDKNQISDKNIFTEILSKYNFNVFLDKAFKQFSLNWLRARINNLKGKGVKSKRENFYFLNGKDQVYDKNYVLEMTNKILSYKKYCDSIGVKFIFVPMPNKETVYYDYVGIRNQPNMLLQLDSILHTKNVETLNTLKVYNEYRRLTKDDSLIYQMDDSHWSQIGVNLVSEELIKKIKGFKK